MKVTCNFKIWHATFASTVLDLTSDEQGDEISWLLKDMVHTGYVNYIVLEAEMRGHALGSKVAKRIYDQRLFKIRVKPSQRESFKLCAEIFNCYLIFHIY